MKAAKPGVKGPDSSSASDGVLQLIQNLQNRIESLEYEINELKDAMYSLQKH